MIPKKIHYCWFGGKEKPRDVLYCIQTWRKFLPDYELVEWNEDSFDISSSVRYVKEAYECKKWAFVSDYVRLFALYNYGGLYFDTDVELFRSFDELLDNRCFFGFESNDYVASAVMGCEEHNSEIKAFLDSYSKRSFFDKNGRQDTVVNVVPLTMQLVKSGLERNGKEQKLSDGTVVFPQSYFASNDIINVFDRYRKGIFAFHHCYASWYENAKGNGKFVLFKHYMAMKLRNAIGTDLLDRIIGKK